MSTPISIGYIENNEYHGITLHSGNSSMVLDLSYLVGMYGFKWYKSMIKKYSGGMSALPPIYAFVDQPISPMKDNFCYGIDYRERGDPRPAVETKDMDMFDYCYAIKPNGQLYEFKYGKLITRKNITKYFPLVIDTVFRIDL